MASHEVFTKQSDGSVEKKIFSAPVGAIFAWGKATPPAHCLECNGATLTVAAYPELGAVLAESGAASFALPDLRGEFIRGWDNGRGVDSGRTLKSSQIDSFKSHGHFINSCDPGISDTSVALVRRILAQVSYFKIVDSSTMENGGSETRPRNVALMYVIVYE